MPSTTLESPVLAVIPKKAKDSAVSSRVPTLDGWRGIAVLLVIAQHAGQEKNALLATIGYLGVFVFFVVSGYIITSRLAQERAHSSSIDLQAFYRRRAARILPLVVIYLATLWLLSRFINLVDFHYRELIASMFFFRNYQFAAHRTGIYTAHFWSLSIEEHFYLFWPSILSLIGNRRALWAALVGAAATGVWRTYSHITWIRTDTMLDGLLIGSSLALALTQPSVLGFVSRNLPKETPIVALLGAFIYLLWARSFPSPTIIFLLIGLMLASTLIVEEGFCRRILNSRLLVWLGTISYSVYIWQQIFLLHPHGVHPLGRLSLFPINIICVLVVSACSFYLIERPLIAYFKQQT